MKGIIFRSLIAGLVMVASVGCDSRKGWSVSGEVQAEEGKIAVEGYNNGRWYVIDSIEVKKDGKFSYRSEAAAPYPEIMRLNGSLLPSPIYFPVSGTDAVVITGDRLSGTAMAEDMNRVDSLVNAATLRLGPAAASDPSLRRELGNMTTTDTTAIIAYYILNKSINGQPIFDPTDSLGNRIYGAVAQRFAEHRPEDPRGVSVRNYYVEGRKAMKKGIEPAQTIELPASGVIEIQRFDDRGQLHSLRELTEEGKVVVLSFTVYQGDYSPAYTMQLNELYEKYRDEGMEIYQIAFDEDDVRWKESAKNLPWITVYNAPTDGVSVLNSYMVGAFPTTFVIDRNGEIRSRVFSQDELEKEIKKYI